MKNLNKYLLEKYNSNYNVEWPINNISELYDWFIKQIPKNLINFIHISMPALWKLHKHGFISFKKQYIEKYLSHTKYSDLDEIKITIKYLGIDKFEFIIELCKWSESPYKEFPICEKQPSIKIDNKKEFNKIMQNFIKEWNN